MNLALLGYSDETLALARAAQLRGHVLAAAFEAGPGLPRLRQLAPGLQTQESWEVLLSGSAIDAVLVGETTAPEVRADQLRKLAAAAVPLVLVCPACEAIVGYEIEMIRRDAQGIILPHLPVTLHPAVAQMANWEARLAAAEGSAGQLVFERGLVIHERNHVLSQLARDVALLRRLWGPITRVLAAGTPGGGELSQLDVHFTMSGNRVARWSLVAGHAPGAWLRLVRGGETCTLQMPTGNNWALELPGSEDRREEFPAWQGAAATLAELESALAHREVALPSFVSACRDAEVAETAARSLARGRGYDILNEDHTERATFMGVMAAGGCLLLMATLLGLLLVAVLSSTGLPGAAGWLRYWPGLLLGVLGLFLVLQLLLAITGGEKTRSR